MAKIPIKQYAFRLIIFSIIVTALTVIMQWQYPQYSTPALPFIVLFFFIITLFTLYIILRADHRKDDKRFISRYLLSRTVKFMSCLIFVFLYIIFNKEDKWRFAIAFIIIYFLFAIFEIFALKGNSKKNRE
jgi:L-asparagine transporter-like permease